MQRWSKITTEALLLQEIVGDKKLHNLFKSWRFWWKPGGDHTPLNCVLLSVPVWHCERPLITAFLLSDTNVSLTLDPRSPFMWKAALNTFLPHFPQEDWFFLSVFIKAGLPWPYTMSCLCSQVHVNATFPSNRPQMGSIKIWNLVLKLLSVDKKRESCFLDSHGAHTSYEIHFYPFWTHKNSDDKSPFRQLQHKSS